jgi:hypothetical protein
MTNETKGEGRVERLTYNAREARQALGVSSTTLWRLEKRGLIAPIGGLRTKLFSIAAIRRFVDGGKAVTA